MQIVVPGSHPTNLKAQSASPAASPGSGRGGGAQTSRFTPPSRRMSSGNSIAGNHRSRSPREGGGKTPAPVHYPRSPSSAAAESGGRTPPTSYSQSPRHVGGRSPADAHPPPSSSAIVPYESNAAAERPYRSGSGRQQGSATNNTLGRVERYRRPSADGSPSQPDLLGAGRKGSRSGYRGVPSAPRHLRVPDLKKDSVESRTTSLRRHHSHTAPPPAPPPRQGQTTAYQRCGRDQNQPTPTNGGPSLSLVERGERRLERQLQTSSRRMERARARSQSVDRHSGGSRSRSSSLASRARNEQSSRERQRPPERTRADRASGDDLNERHRDQASSSSAGSLQPVVRSLSVGRAHRPVQPSSQTLEQKQRQRSRSDDILADDRSARSGGTASSDLTQKRGRDRINAGSGAANSALQQQRRSFSSSIRTHESGKMYGSAPNLALAQNIRRTAPAATGKPLSSDVIEDECSLTDAVRG